jgi:hypothetical protein
MKSVWIRSSAENESDVLKDLISDAALQRQLMEAREADCELIEEGWTFDYAVGADVVSLHAEPANKSTARKGLAIGHGELFRRDEPRRKDAVANALGLFLTYVLSGKKPLLLLPPINRQFRRIVEAMGARVQASPGGAGNQLAMTVRNILAKAELPSEHDIRQLREAALTADTPGQLIALRELVRAGRLRSLESGPLPALFDISMRHATRLTYSLSEERIFDSARSRWIDALGNAGRDMDFQNVREAATALARLEIINQRLVDLKLQHRVLYITGDNAVLVAGEQDPRMDNMRARADEWLAARPNFTNAYLRHPRAFLGEPGVLNSKDQAHVGAPLSHLLTLWLGSLSDIKEGFGRRNENRVKLHLDVERRIDAAVRVNPVWASRIGEDWAHAAEKAEALPLPEAYLQVLDRSVEGKESLASRLSGLAEATERSTAEAWGDFSDLLVEFRFHIDATTPMRPRAPPLLYFELQPQMVAFFQDARKWAARESEFTKEAYDAHRKAIGAIEPGGSYFLNLAHAWWLSVQGHWRSAQIVTERALAATSASGNHLSHGEKGSEESLLPGGPNGREANLLAAVCVRHGAKRRKDLLRAQTFLLEAVRIARREETEGVHRDIVHERFVAEHLASRLSGRLFDWHDMNRPGFAGGYFA